MGTDINNICRKCGFECETGRCPYTADGVVFSLTQHPKLNEKGMKLLEA